MVVDFSGLISSGGEVQHNGNTSATIIDFGSLVEHNGDVTVEGNTSATSVQHQLAVVRRRHREPQ